MLYEHRYKIIAPQTLQLIFMVNVSERERDAKRLRASWDEAAWTVAHTLRQFVPSNDLKPAEYWLRGNDNKK